MKKQFIQPAVLMFLVLGLLIIGCKKDDTTPVMPTAGLVAYYPFDNNAQDASSFHNHGEIFGAQFVNGHTGKANAAIVFDGVNDYVKVPHSGAINFGADQDYTICFWVKFAGQANTKWNDNYILSKWDPEPAAPFILTMDNQNGANSTPGAWHSGRTDGSCGHSSAVGSMQNRADDDQWHHLVVQKKATVLISYMDGIEIQESPDNSICNTQNTAPLLIAAQGIGKQGGWFKGAMDELCIYNRALSADEIKLLFEKF